MQAYIRIFALFVGISAWSQNTESPLSLTLEEAITYGLENNYSSINARREVAKAIQQKWETTATGLPQINGQVDYTNRFKQLVTLIPGEVAGGQPGSLVPVVFGVQHTANVGLSLNQLIFDGSYLVGLKAAKAFMEFNENNEEKIRLEVRRGIINAYGAALLSDENISILENNVKSVEKNLLETQKIYENGLAEEEDVEQLKITLSQLKNQLQNGYRLKSIAYQMFNLAIGIEIDAPVILIDQLENLATESINPQFNNTSFDPQNNADYKIAQNLIKQRELEWQLARSRALPKLSGIFNYTTSYFDNEFTLFESGAQWFESGFWGINIEVPLFSSLGRSANTKRAKIALDQAETGLTETEQQIRLNWETAVNNYNFFINSFQTSKNNLQLAERIVNKNEIKFSNGIATSFELRQAQLQLYAAQQEYLQSLLNIIDQKAELETLLNTYN